MAKSQKNQTYVLKINTKYLSKHGWNLNLNLEDVRRDSQMVVALGSSQVLRWLSAIQGRQNDDELATVLKNEISRLKKQPNSLDNKQRIKSLYRKLYATQFQQDYVMLVMDSVKDYRRALKGFTITVDGVSVKYKRLLGTTGSIKKSTIIFVNEDVHDELMSRINNGRDMSKKFVAAKLNAYCALACSASISVTWPRIIVVDDAKTVFNHDVLLVDNSDPNQEEPSVEYVEDQEIVNKVSDGMGFITPEMSAKWAEELHEGSEPLSGYNTRCSFLKGMVFCVDFVKFAKEVAGTYSIIDAYGTERDVRDADIIITTSMLKLWDSYPSYEAYYENCMKNNYDFCVAKSTPHVLRDVHTTNYQYLQDFDLTDEQIEELISPTVQRIKDALGLDWRAMLLYLCGHGINERSIPKFDAVSRAIMTNPEVAKDPYIRSKIQRMIQKRVRTAKIGVLEVEGDYAIVGNDPYSLLQSIFGLPITGLLKAGECYHRYWSDKAVDEVVMFRAPMTSHNNVCKMKVVANDEMNEWYQYIKTCCLINSWDTTPIRLNGCDYDSDSVFTTNNKVLLESFVWKPTLMCTQSNAEMVVPKDEDFIKSEINGFGDSIGSITNRATNMISLRDAFPRESDEYKTLAYRINTMMLYQQDAIDRIKGIIARPIPKKWISASANKAEDEDYEVGRKVAAELKPYFFIYRYTQLANEYHKYMKNVESNCKKRFGKSLNQLDADSANDEERDFYHNYIKYMPISMAPGTMNRICWAIECAFPTLDVYPKEEFDYTIYKSDAAYTDEEFLEVALLFDDYCRKVQLLIKGQEWSESADADADIEMLQLKKSFADLAAQICPDEKALANIVLDLCYHSNKAKTFAWDIAGETFVSNLIEKNNGVMMYPEKCIDGEYIYGGEHFTIKTIQEGLTNDIT